MLSSVLNGDFAKKMSAHIIETFVQLRKMVNNYAGLMQKIQTMELHNNEQFQEIYKGLQHVLSQPKLKERQDIAFKKDR